MTALELTYIFHVVELTYIFHVVELTFILHISELTYIFQSPSIHTAPGYKTAGLFS